MATTTTAAFKINLNGTDTESPNDLPKAVVTIGILVIAFLLAIAIAKLASYCYKRRAIPDDVSDMSDHTKNLLRKQLELMRFGKKTIPDQPLDEEAQKAKTANVLNMWRNKVREKMNADKKDDATDNNENDSEKQGHDNLAMTTDFETLNPKKLETKKPAKSNNQKPSSEKLATNSETKKAVGGIPVQTSPRKSASNQKTPPNKQQSSEKPPVLRFFSQSTKDILAASRQNTAANKDANSSAAARPPEVST